MNQKLIYPLILKLLLSLFFVLLFFSLKQHTQSFNFADESEHLVPAWEILQRKKVLYQDLSTNHQPLPIFFSVILIKIFPFTNLFMLIDRARQIMILFSFFGALVLTLRFKATGLIAAILIESIKFYFFGYHILSESLIVYPIMIVTGLLFIAFVNENKKKPRTIDGLLFGGSLFWLAFNWLPALPFLLAILYIYLKKQKKSLKLTAASFLIPTLILFTQINPKLWFQESVVNPFLYLIPYESQIKSIPSILKLVTYPFLGFANISQPIARYYVGLISLVTLSMLILIKQDKNKKKIISYFLIFYFLTILLNIRIPSIDISFYSAFHILPQAAFLTMFVIITSFQVIKILQDEQSRKSYQMVFIIVIALILVSSTQWLREKKDKLNDHFIQYGEEESIGMALSTIKHSDDTLLAGTQAGYINLMSGLPLATRLSAYLPWSYSSPKLRVEFQNQITDHRPTFIYFPKSENPYYKYLEPMLLSQYTRLQRADLGLTNAYILSSEIKNRTADEWLEFEMLFYTRPYSK